jgi:hypothetical protein
MTSVGQVVYSDASGNPDPHQHIGGTHTINNDASGGQAGVGTISSQEGQWAGTLSGIDGVNGNCYHGRVSAHADLSEWRTVLSDFPVCFQAPPPPPPPPPIRASCEEGTPDCPSPIVLNLGHGIWSLTDIDHGVRFDLDADGGVPERFRGAQSVSPWRSSRSIETQTVTSTTATSYLGISPRCAMGSELRTDLSLWPSSTRRATD